MFHRVSHIDQGAINPGFHQGAVQQFAGGPHERMTLPVFLVPGLLADKNYFSRGWPFAKDSLTRPRVQVASLATLYGYPQGARSRMLRDELRGARGGLLRHT